MTEPTRPFAPRSDDGHHERQAALLDRIEAEGRIPGWAWTAVSETLARLRDLPDGWAHVATRYLTQVARRGHQMFPDETYWQTGLWQEREAPTLPCRCGRNPQADRPTYRRGREINVARCDCGRYVAAYDGELWTRPTLISDIM